jgi:hypothetical protein
MQEPKITGLPILFYRIRYNPGMLFVVTQCGFVSWIFPAAPACLTVYVTDLVNWLQPYPLMHKETKTQLVTRVNPKGAKYDFWRRLSPKDGNVWLCAYTSDAD